MSTNTTTYLQALQHALQVWDDQLAVLEDQITPPLTRLAALSALQRTATDLTVLTVPDRYLRLHQGVHAAFTAYNVATVLCWSAPRVEHVEFAQQVIERAITALHDALAELPPEDAARGLIAGA